MTQITTTQNGWTYIPFGELVDVNPTESLPKGASAKSVPMDCIDSFTRKISRFNKSEFKGGTKFKNGDTLLARITPCLENGKTSYVDFLDENEIGFGSTEYLVLREKESISDKKFIYYLATSPKFREIAIKAMTGTSGRQRVQTEQLINTNFFIPPLTEQRAIAAVLSSLDDKIELLREQNKTLEDVAERLFQEWFGRYGIDDDLPVGWKVGKFDDVTDIRGGTTPSTKNPNFWDGNLAWTSPKDLSNSRETFLLQTEKKITAEGLKQISSGLLPRGSLLLSSRAPIGYLAISDLEIAINQGYIAFLPNQYFSNYFMFLWLKLNMQEVINASNGSTFLEISKSSFRNIECVIPAEDILKSFDVIIQPLFQKILSNLHQVKIISTLRDALLPRLMQGDVRAHSNSFTA